MLLLLSAAIVAGAMLTHRLQQLPAWKDVLTPCLVLLATVTILQVFTHPSNFLRWVVKGSVVLAACVLSMTWTMYQAQQRLADALDPVHENVVTKLSFRVNSMRQEQSDSQRFEALVLDPERPGIPRHIQVVWQDPHAGRIVVLPGQVWRAALVLKRPHGATNPHGFDYEGLMFQRNIRAIGKLRGTPVHVRDEPFASFGVVVARIRHTMRDAMRSALGPARYAPVLIALAIGDQDSVLPEDWEVFNRTGITHLVSISGSHVTMIGALAGMLVLWLGKRLRVGNQALAERIPARVLAAVAAMAVAFLYCLLAGWGVPARRTFLMLSVVATALLARLSISMPHVLGIAAACVTFMDPWSPLSTGFWLSFLAVGILFCVGSQTPPQCPSSTLMQRLRGGLLQAMRLQWLITIAMVPILAFLFQQVSLSSPLANAIAIPVMSFVVTPLALLTAVFATIPGGMLLATGAGWLGHLAMSWSMVPITWFAEAPWAMIEVSAMPIWWFGLAMLGVVWALQPPGLPARWAGWCLLLPALVWQPERPRPGAWKLWVMDVGQGAAVIVQTAQKNILIDTGPRLGNTDAAARVLLPALRALGIRQIDHVFVSHADADHSGGLVTLLQKFNVAHVHASFDVADWLKQKSYDLVAQPLPLLSLCEAGQKWVLDDVQLTLLHPSALLPAEDQARQKKIKQSANDRSCVLHLAGHQHSVLFPGDIGSKQEQEILQRFPPQADLVLMPHHGSRTSSSRGFVSHLGARHAVAQVGHLNRFGHPHAEISERWLTGGATLWRTDQHGAIYVESRDDIFVVDSLRLRNKRYWHHAFER